MKMADMLLLKVVHFTLNYRQIKRSENSVRHGSVCKTSINWQFTDNCICLFVWGGGGVVLLQNDLKYLNCGGWLLQNDFKYLN